MTIKTTLLAALRQYRGDNLERARMAFRGLSPEKMDEQYGESGMTRREILEGYERHAAEVDSARMFVEKLPETP